MDWWSWLDILHTHDRSSRVFISSDTCSTTPPATNKQPAATTALPKAKPGTPMLPPQVSRPGGRNVVTEDSSAWMSRAAVQKAKEAEAAAARRKPGGKGGEGGGRKGEA